MVATVFISVAWMIILESEVVVVNQALVYLHQIIEFHTLRGPSLIHSSDYWLRPLLLFDFLMLLIDLLLFLTCIISVLLIVNYIFPCGFLLIFSNALIFSSSSWRETLLIYDKLIGFNKLFNQRLGLIIDRWISCFY